MTTQHEAAALGMDDPWLAESPRRSRLRLLLVAMLAVALLFYAGVEVQSGTARRRRAQPPARKPAPSPHLTVLPFQEETLMDAGNQGSADSGATTVIGTVVSLKADKLVVEDFGGTKHTITIGADVRIVLETAGISDDVKRGSTVQVSGQADEQDHLSATTITVR